MNNDKIQDYSEQMLHYFQLLGDLGLSEIKRLAILNIDYAVRQEKLRRDVEAFKASPNGEKMRAMETIARLEKELRKCQEGDSDDEGESSSHYNNKKLNEEDPFRGFKKQ